MSDGERQQVGRSPLPVVLDRARALDRTVFEGHEQCLAPYLVSLADIANSVADEPRGAITGGWWRTGERPFDARVQEYSLVLVWFLTQRRAWNPYTGDPALAARTQAALERYLALQHASGAWPEYAAEQHSRSATGFALESLGSTLRMLTEADMLPELHQPIATAVRRAIDWYMNPANTEIWWPGYTPIVNQPTGAIAGALRCLDTLQRTPALNDPADHGRRTATHDRLTVLRTTGASAVGHFHEPTGNDFQYTMHVMLPALGELTAETDLAEFAGPLQRYAEWFGLHAVLEPDGLTYVLNGAASARTHRQVLSTAADPSRLSARASRLIELAPGLAAFLPAAEDHERLQRDWATASEPVEPLTPPASVRVLSDAVADRYPTRDQRRAAQAELPYLRADRWARLLTNEAHEQYLFVRRPGYYLCATLGVRTNELIRTGPGLLWHPALGAVVAGENGLGEAAWTAVREGAQVADADAFTQLFDGAPPDAPLVAEPFADRPLGLRYHDGPNAHQVDWVFEDARLVCTVHAAGALAVQIPVLVHEGDDLQVSQGAAELMRAGVGRFRITGPGRPATAQVAWSVEGVSRVVVRFAIESGPLTVTYELEEI